MALQSVALGLFCFCFLRRKRMVREMKYPVIHHFCIICIVRARFSCYQVSLEPFFVSFWNEDLAISAPYTKSCILRVISINSTQCFRRCTEKGKKGEKKRLFVNVQTRDNFSFFFYYKVLFLFYLFDLSFCEIVVYHFRYLFHKIPQEKPTRNKRRSREKTLTTPKRKRYSKSSRLIRIEIDTFTGSVGRRNTYLDQKLSNFGGDRRGERRIKHTRNRGAETRVISTRAIDIYQSVRRVIGEAIAETNERSARSSKLG